MKNAVKDLVLRMTGGNAAVAEICAAVVSDVEEGNVCCRVGAEELDTLAAEPSVACFVDASSDAPCAETPFVVYGDLLYTRRNWLYERNVVKRIAAMAANVSADEVELPANDFYSQLRDEQRDAVVAMCKAQFTILTGGPGTGKTHTIARAVKYLRDSNPGMRLALAAHLVYITNILDSDIIAIDISVKYCINARTEVTDDVPFDTKYALTAITPTIPIFISIVIMGFTIPIIIPARLSFRFSFLFASSKRAFS